MHERGLYERVTALLHATNVLGGYHCSLVCTEQGLPIASSGDGIPDEDLAAFTSLFDDIVQRATRDMGMTVVDEVTLLDPHTGRLVIRPLSLDGEHRLFLVVRVPVKASWRRNTNRLVLSLSTELAPLIAHADAEVSP